MSATQQLEDGARVDSAPQPPRAPDRDRNGDRHPQSPRRERAGQRSFAFDLLRVGSLVMMAVVLLAGYWKPHPLVSLVVPAAAVVLWIPAIRTRRVERWLLYYVAGIYLYTVLRALADEFGFPIRSDYVIAADRLLFGGVVPSVALQHDFFSPSDVDWIDVSATAIHASFFVVPHAAAAYIWLRHPRALPGYVASVLLALYIGLVLFILLPTVPPWLAARRGDLAVTYRVLDFVLRGVDIDAYRSLYRTLAEPNAVASVPSIHMAITCVVLLRSRDFAPRWFWPLLLYAVAMALALIYLGEHYAFDIIVGTGVAIAVEIAVRRGLRRRRVPVVEVPVPVTDPPDGSASSRA